MSLARWQKTAVVALLAVTAAFGGLRDADHVTPVVLGQTYDNGALSITPASVSVMSALPWLATLTPECRFIVLDATIENTGAAAVPLPTGISPIGKAGDCAELDASHSTDGLAIANLASRFAGALRVRDEQPVPYIDPGFTERMQLAWVVPASELDNAADIQIDLRTMTDSFSTFRISRQWIVDEDRYGRLRVANPER